MDSFSLDDANESMKEPNACFVNFLRPLSERLLFYIMSSSTLSRIDPDPDP